MSGRYNTKGLNELHELRSDLVKRYRNEESEKEKKYLHDSIISLNNSIRIIEENMEVTANSQPGDYVNFAVPTWMWVTFFTIFAIDIFTIIFAILMAIINS